MNLRIVTIFITINMFLFAEPITTLNNNITVNIGQGKVDYTTYTIYADATAELTSGGLLQSELQLILQSKAEEETIKTLYATLGKISFNSDETVDQIIQNNEPLNEYVLNAVNNARLVGISYPTIRSIKVIMALDLVSTNRLLSKFIDSADEYRTTPIITYFNTGSDYDSLVIDARNIGFNPSLFPTIYDEDGNAIYSVSYINKASAITNGYVMYTTNTSFTNEKFNILGKKPYNVVAWNPRGRLSGDIVIGNEDASIIMSSPKLKNAIKNCKVAIIID